MIVAAFHGPDDLSHALARLREARVGPLQTYTPAPLDGEDTWSPLPLAILVAGLAGAAASFALQTWSAVVAYPFIAGNRPFFAWASFIPNTFENAVLVAIVAGFVGYFLVNRMPRLYEPVDEADAMRRASSDRWCLAVHNRDHAVLDRARDVLGALHPAAVEEVPG